MLTLRRKTAFSALFVGAAYFLGGQIGTVLSLQPDHIATFWPPNAVVLAALLLTQPRDWWPFLAVVLPAELAADAMAGVGPLTALGFAMANIIEVLVAALLLRRFAGLPFQFDNRRNAGLFLLFAVVVAPLASSPLGAVTATLGLGGHFSTNWARFLMGDALAQLIVTPTVLSWAGLALGKRRPSFARIAEFTSAMLVLALLSVFIFGSAEHAHIGGVGYMFLPLPVLLWIAMRMGVWGTSTATVLVSLTAIAYAIQGVGPFTSPDPAQNVFGLQVYVMCVFLPLLFLSAIIEEQRRTRAMLQAVRESLEETVVRRTAELAQANAALLKEVAEHRESEERFRLTFDQSPLGAAMSDLDYRFLRVNQEYCRITGYSEEELSSLTFADITHPEDRPGNLDKAEALRRGEIERYQMEKRYIHKDGKTVWARITPQVVRNGAGKPLLLRDRDRGYHRAQG